MTALAAASADFRPANSNAFPTGMPDSNIVANDRQIITSDLVRMRGLNTVVSGSCDLLASTTILAKKWPPNADGSDGDGLR